jgi:hypothetical protein
MRVSHWDDPDEHPENDLREKFAEWFSIWDANRQRSEVRRLGLPKFAILWIKLLPTSDQVGFRDSRNCNGLAVGALFNLNRERTSNA